MLNPTAILGALASLALTACASQSPSSYPREAGARLAAYARATPCCDDPSGFPFAALPARGQAQVAVDEASPVFDFQSGLSPFAAFTLPDAEVPYRIRVKSVFDRKAGNDDAVFYPVIALLDDTFIVVHMSGLESLRLELALATVGGETGLAVSVGVDPAERTGKYLVVFTPAVLLGMAPPPDREGDVLSISALAYMEQSGESALPASPYGQLRITVAPEVTLAGAQSPD